MDPSDAGGAPALTSGAPVPASVRLLRRAFKGSLIAGSSMVLAACYGCPPAECSSTDFDGSGASGSVNTGGGVNTGGSVNTGGGFSTGGGLATGGAIGTGGDSLGGSATAGEGGMGGFGGDLGGDAP